MSDLGGDQCMHRCMDRLEELERPVFYTGNNSTEQVGDSMHTDIQAHSRMDA